MIQQKKGASGWIWFLIVVLIVLVGLGVYFWLSGSSDGGGSIPQPPALPSE